MLPNFISFDYFLFFLSHNFVEYHNFMYFSIFYIHLNSLLTFLNFINFMAQTNIFLKFRKVLPINLKIFISKNKKNHIFIKSRILFSFFIIIKFYIINITHGFHLLLPNYFSLLYFLLFFKNFLSLLFIVKLFSKQIHCFL